jgi:membrane complex biogenesis BtpA family protein
MGTWLDEIFGVPKPVIAMLHPSALPGDPDFGPEGGITAVVERARRELDALQSGGVDGIMLSNEFSLPYLTRTEPITAIAMARIIGGLHEEIAVPYGVNVLWGARASIDLAAATDAAWVREIFTGVYAGDFGLWNTNVGEVARHRHRIGTDDIKLIFNVVPESARYLADRDLTSIVQTTVFASLPDAICVSGLTAGAPTDSQALATAEKAAGSTPVFVNTGVCAANAADQLAVADGAIVGTFFKEDGVFENPAGQPRVAELMSVIHDFRRTL